MGFEEIQAAGELLSTPGEPRSGSGESQEASIRIAQTRFPNKGFCIVQQWTIVREIASDGISPKSTFTGTCRSLFSPKKSS